MIAGRSEEVLQDYADNTFTACVTDPPYELNIRGEKWDDEIPIAVFEQTFRTLKPGAHLLAFGSPRTFHRLATIVETCGFIIQDTLMWVYGDAMPMGSDITRLIDTSLEVKRDVRDVKVAHRSEQGTWATDKPGDKFRAGTFEYERTKATSALAKLWDGYHTRVKTSYQPIVWAMKPVERNYVLNAQKWGVAGLNIEECKIGERFPSNIMFDEHCASMLDRMTRTESRPSLYFYVPRIRNNDTGHIARKPLELMMYLLRLVKTPEPMENIILDPFAGSGATLEACAILAMECVAIEQDEKYIKRYEERLAKQTDLWR